MAWVQLTELIGYALASTDLVYENLSTGYVEIGGNHIVVANTPVSVSNFVYGQTPEKNLSWTFNENANCTNLVRTQGSGVATSGYFNYKGSDNVWRSRGFSGGGGGSSGISNVNYTDFVFFINDELQEGDVIYFRYMQRAGVTGYCGREATQLQRQYIYQILKGLIPPEYNWQSVPSLTGKGKTVQLSTLNDINDGEEVITDDTSKFNLTTASNLVTLVQK